MTQKLGVLVMLAACGIASAASTTTLKIEVSTDGLNWSRSLHAHAGQIVQARVSVTFNGPGAVGGLANFCFQPVIANWGDTDTILPYVRDLSQRQGHVAYDHPLPGQEAYGRLAPFASVMLPDGSDGYGDRRLGEHLQTVNGVRYLRIAQTRTDWWIGQGPTSGSLAVNNYNGAGGIPIAQPSPGLADYEMFDRDFRTTDVPVFKFAFVPGAGEVPRTMALSVPAGSLQFKWLLSQGSRRGFSWFTGPEFDPWPPHDSDIGELLGSEVIVNPAPWSALGLAGLLAIRRRR